MKIKMMIMIMIEFSIISFSYSKKKVTRYQLHLKIFLNFKGTVPGDVYLNPVI